jgi:hypothetical protein
MRRFAGIAAIAACVACGCAKPSTQSKEPADASVTVDQGNGKTKTKGRGADGSATNSNARKVKVPEDFPKDIPVYPGATPIIHQSVKNGRTLELKTSDAADKVTAFYKEKLKAEGWKQVSESSSQSLKEGITLLSNTKDKHTLSVVISHGENGTSLTLSVSTKE